MSTAFPTRVPHPLEPAIAPGPPRLPVRLIGSLGRRSLSPVGGLGRLFIFGARAAAGLVRRPLRPHLIVEQIHFFGRRSVALIGLTASLTGMVLALQSYNALVRFGSDAYMGSLVSLTLIKELGPVLAALMVTARAGSATAAQLGNMRMTEQMDALESMAIEPVKYLVSPRLAGAVISVPLLTAGFSLAGIYLGYLLAVYVLGVDGGVFMGGVRDSVEWIDVREGIVKSIAFGGLIAWIACYRGYTTWGGSRAVGRSTSRAVVEISAVVLLGDYLMTALFF